MNEQQYNKCIEQLTKLRSIAERYITGSQETLHDGWQYAEHRAYITAMNDAISILEIEGTEQ